MIRSPKKFFGQAFSCSQQSPSDRNLNKRESESSTYEQPKSPQTLANETFARGRFELERADSSRHNLDEVADVVEDKSSNKPRSTDRFPTVSSYQRIINRQDFYKAIGEDKLEELERLKAENLFGGDNIDVNEAKPNVAKNGNQTFETPLYKAARSGSERIVKFLLSVGADPQKTLVIANGHIINLKYSSATPVAIDKERQRINDAINLMLKNTDLVKPSFNIKRYQTPAISRRALSTSAEKQAREMRSDPRNKGQTQVTEIDLGLCTQKNNSVEDEQKNRATRSLSQHIRTAYLKSGLNFSGAPWLVHHVKEDLKNSETLSTPNNADSTAENSKKTFNELDNRNSTMHSPNRQFAVSNSSQDLLPLPLRSEGILSVIEPISVLETNALLPIISSPRSANLLEIPAEELNANQLISRDQSSESLVGVSIVPALVIDPKLDLNSTLLLPKTQLDEVDDDSFNNSDSSTASSPRDRFESNGSQFESALINPTDSDSDNDTQTAKSLEVEGSTQLFSDEKNEAKVVVDQEETSSHVPIGSIPIQIETPIIRQTILVRNESDKHEATSSIYSSPKQASENVDQKTEAIGYQTIDYSNLMNNTRRAPNNHLAEIASLQALPPFSPRSEKYLKRVDPTISTPKNNQSIKNNSPERSAILLGTPAIDSHDEELLVEHDFEPLVPELNAANLGDISSTPNLTKSEENRFSLNLHTFMKMFLACVCGEDSVETAQYDLNFPTE
ncbi:MAG: hypothetical protein V4629_07365 [Pseudomonadota bacterium]